MELPGDQFNESFGYDPDPVNEYDSYLDEMGERHPAVASNVEPLYEMVADESDIAAAKSLIDRLTRPNMN